MAEPHQLVRRLLDTPDIERVVPRLPPDVLHRLIDQCGLEACGDIVALATPGQLGRLLDLDLWRAASPGADQTLDAARFGRWLEVLLQSGADVAADRLTAMDVELVVDGLAAHVRVFDGASVASYVMLDGTEVSGWAPARGQVCEIGGLVIEGRPSSAWDAIVEVLVQLHEDAPFFFSRVMRGCIALSSGESELDVSHELLEERDQHAFDLAVEREGRRDRLGYVTPADARAFLHTSIHFALDGGQPPRNAVAAASLRALESHLREGDGVQAPSAEDVSPVDPSGVTAVVEILREEGVLAPPRALLTAGTADGDGRLALVRDFADTHLASAEELAFLTNALIAGGVIQGRSFTAQEAADAVSATCNLGLENWPADWSEPNLVTAFQVGWTLLQRDMSRPAATALIRVLADLECSDRDAHWALQALGRELTQRLRDGEPWRARQALDALLMLDAPAWAVLRALIDECPMMHAAVRSGRLLRIDPAACTFVARNSEIAMVHGYLASLATALAG